MLILLRRMRVITRLRDIIDPRVAAKLYELRDEAEARRQLGLGILVAGFRVGRTGILERPQGLERPGHRLADKPADVVGAGGRWLTRIYPGRKREVGFILE